MAIIFNCPYCGEGYRLKDDAAGKAAKCRRQSCGKTITVPKPVSAEEAEALAMAALLEEAAAAQAEAEVEKFKFPCPQCSTEHEVERSMEGKNMRCPECGKIVRIPKLEKQKAADWRDVNDGRPTLAKRDDPKLDGATEAARMVSADAMKKGGGFDVEEEEDPRDRKIRLAKRLVYGLLFISVCTFVIMYYLRSRSEKKTEKWMELAIREIDESPESATRPELQAAVRRYAGEYYLRSAKNKSEIESAANQFKQALGKLQKSTVNSSDRAAMLMELSAAMTILGGDSEQVRDEKRMPWSDVQRMIQQPFQQAGAVDADQREWGTRALTRAFAAHNQGGAVYNVARYAYPGTEADCAGRIGLELIALGQKETAQELLKKAPPGEAPSMTALRLALNPETISGKETPLTAQPSKKGDILPQSRMAYAEALAYQGKLQEAKELAERPSKIPAEIVRALTTVAAVALDVSKDNSTAGAIIENAAAISLQSLKDNPQPGWLIVRLATLAARVGKLELSGKLADSINDDSIRGWAKLEILRVRLAALSKQKAEESWLDPLPDGSKSPSLAAMLARTELARQNAAAGETSFANIIEKTWPKGTVRPFGYAGTALGNQDRNRK